VTIDRSTGAISRNEEFYALGQFGRVVRPGARRIDSTRLSGDVRTVAFVNTDGSRALLATNSATTATRATFVEDARSFSYDLPPRSVVSFTWS
jgi:glucosylceramidase